MVEGWLPAVVAYTGFSLAFLFWRVQVAVENGAQGVSPDAWDASHTDSVLKDLFEAKDVATLAVFVNLLVNSLLLFSILTKTIFFGQLRLHESQKLAERVVNYVLFKGFFLAAVVRAGAIQEQEIPMWVAWLAILGYVKIFGALARDRFESLNASPSASTFARVRTAIILICLFVVDLFCIHVCIAVYTGQLENLSYIFLLLFEPVLIALDSLQTMVQLTNQVMDTWQDDLNSDMSHGSSSARHSVSDVAPTEGGASADLSESAAALASPGPWSLEWRRTFLYHFNFFMEMSTLTMTLIHYTHIWRIKGFSLHLIDAVLFLNVRAIISALKRRILSFVRYRTAMRNLREAFPDATKQEIRDYDDDCAICKEPMYVAKRLPCAHLFHVSCLRSWLDQGSADNYSCPTCRTSLLLCRKPLAAVRAPLPPAGAAHAGIPSHPVGVPDVNGWRATLEDQPRGAQAQEPSGGSVAGSASQSGTGERWAEDGTLVLPARSTSWQHLDSASSALHTGPSRSLPRSTLQQQQYQQQHSFDEVRHRQLLQGGSATSFASMTGGDSAARHGVGPPRGAWEGGRGGGSGGGGGGRSGSFSWLLGICSGRRGGNGGTGGGAGGMWRIGSGGGSGGRSEREREGATGGVSRLVTDQQRREMVAMVREVLPQVPEEVIIEDLARTRSAETTINNLLEQMLSR